MKKVLGFISVLMLAACQPGLDYQQKGSPRGLFEHPEDIRFVPKKTEEFTLTRPNETEPRLSRQGILHGRERYEIYCAVCHGYAGNGDGIAVNRGFPKPSGFRGGKEGRKEIYQIIRNGKGIMQSFSNHIPPRDAWDIASYVQVLERRKQ